MFKPFSTTIGCQKAFYNLNLDEVIWWIIIRSSSSTYTVDRRVRKVNPFQVFLDSVLYVSRTERLATERKSKVKRVSIFQLREDN